MGEASTVGLSADGLDRSRLGGWFAEHVAGANGNLTFDRIEGGNSNLTFAVSINARRRWVLRRPPLMALAARAHDVAREHRIISALRDHVPVPPAVGLCEDHTVTGASFYVAEFVDGHVLRNPRDAECLTERARRRAGTGVVEHLAAIHSIDPAEVGLGDLGSTSDYLRRQARRWRGQLEVAQTSSGRSNRTLDAAFEHLTRAMPEPGPTAIVHGDYRLDNCIVDQVGDVLAVLDWELCTLGDPLADVGMLMVYWTEAGDDSFALLEPSATVLAGFPNRADAIRTYERCSGFELGSLAYYVAFGYWKLACMVEGVYARFASGAVPPPIGGYRAFAEQADRLAYEALRILRS